jgi:hypothetical protein
MIRANARQNGSDGYTFRDLQEMNDFSTIWGAGRMCTYQNRRGGF